MAGVELCVRRVILLKRLLKSLFRESKTLTIMRMMAKMMEEKEGKR